MADLIYLNDSAIIDLATVKTHIGLPSSDTSEDDYLGVLLEASTRYVEKYLGFDLRGHEYQILVDDGTLNPVQLPKYSTLEDVSSEDGSSLDVTVTATVLGPKVTPVDTWPEGGKVAYVPLPSILEGNIKAAILLILSDLYEERSDSLEDGHISSAAQRLLDLSRTRTGI